MSHIGGQLGYIRIAETYGPKMAKKGRFGFAITVDTSNALHIVAAYFTFKKAFPKIRGTILIQLGKGGIHVQSLVMWNM